jgi:transposase InsO family protein
VSTYYAAKKRSDARSDREIRDEELLLLIRAAWEEKGKRLYGARKVWKQLRRGGVDVARCTVERLMRAEGMMGAVARRRRPRTTIPGHESARPRDLVEPGFRAPAPNQLWVVDITYVELAGGGFCYTAFVTDVFSRAIVGWQVLDTLKIELALDALEMALWARKERLSTALVHHGDRGVQYTSIRYGQRLIDAGVNVPSAVKAIHTTTHGNSITAQIGSTPNPPRYLSTNSVNVAVEGEKSRRQAQDLIRPPRFPQLTLQLRDTRVLIRFRPRHPLTRRTPTLVVLAYPVP